MVRGGRKAVRDFSESNTATEEPPTKREADGQLIMTEADTPLSEACDKLVQAKAQYHQAKQNLVDADNEWCEAMKEAKLTKIGHKGDTIQLVTGKTSKDHSRFMKT